MSEAPEFPPQLFIPLEDERKFTHLTPLEHAMFGSSIKFEGQTMGVLAILARGPNFFLRPLATLEAEPINLREIAEGRHNRYLDRIVIFERYLKGHRSRLFLPDVYPNGIVQPFFSLELISNQTNKAITAEETRVLLSNKDGQLVDELRETLQMGIFLPIKPQDKTYLFLQLKKPYEHNPYRKTTS